MAAGARRAFDAARPSALAPRSSSAAVTTKVDTPNSPPMRAYPRHVVRCRTNPRQMAAGRRQKPSARSVSSCTVAKLLYEVSVWNPSREPTVPPRHSPTSREEASSPRRPRAAAGACVEKIDDERARRIARRTLRRRRGAARSAPRFAFRCARTAAWHPRIEVMAAVVEPSSPKSRGTRMVLGSCSWRAPSSRSRRNPGEIDWFRRGTMFRSTLPPATSHQPHAACVQRKSSERIRNR